MTVINRLSSQFTGRSGLCERWLFTSRVHYKFRTR